MRPGWFKGSLVGFINVVVVAVMMAIMICVDESEGAGVFANVVVMVVVVGFLPAALLGALAGHLATSMQGNSRGVMLAGMIVTACSVVVMLGHVTFMDFFVPYATIPTIVSCCVLERWTRRKPDVDSIVCVA